MKLRNKFSLIISLSLLTCIIFSTSSLAISVIPVSPSGKKVTGNQWLFVIGINTYIEWPRLDTAVSDARAVKDVLLSRYHFDDDHTIELYDADATRSNIIAKLRFFAKTLKEDDSLFVFYAGHGHLDQITKKGSWIPMESGIEDTSAWISNDFIKDYFRADAIKAKHVLLVSDSCFSGDFFRGHRGKLPTVTDEVIRRSYELTSRQAITSGGLEPVTDSGFGNNSVFTHFFVQMLKNNDEPFLVPSAFFPDIKAGVAENAEQFPQFGSLKNTGGQQGGEFVFFLKQDAQLQNLSDIEARKRKEYEHLLKMEQEANLAKKREAAEMAEKEKELADLDQKINAMKNRLGTSQVKSDDSLDAMLAMVKQKEDQAKRLADLKKQRQEEQQEREAEIARLKREQEEKTIAMLRPEVEKYKKIVSSEYGKDLKESAWQALISKCPPGWADGADKYDANYLLLNSLQRKEIIEEMERENSIREAQEKLRDEKLAAEAKKLEEQKSIVSEDKNFIRYGSGIFYEKKTGLDWYAGPDRDASWYDVESWAKHLNIAGGDWRVPSLSELENIFANESVIQILNSKKKRVWAIENCNDDRHAWYKFYTHKNAKSWTNKSTKSKYRALVVRKHVDPNKANFKHQKTVSKCLGCSFFGVRNDDTVDTLYFEHPDDQDIIKLLPGETEVIVIKAIPKYLYGKWTDRGKRLSFRIHKGARKPMNGIKVDFGTAPYNKNNINSN